ncbi:sulfatase-like hydrolase/transferase [Helicobacter sp. 23-1046]
MVFITSGNRSWHNLGDYIITQGADKVFDKNELIRLYPQSAEFESDYGVPDEYAFKLALEILQNATKPTFIAMLTISNHPPYKIPTHFTLPHCNIESLREYFNNDNIAKNREAVNAFAYSSNAFGDFVGVIKADSRLKDSTIIAGSGDHKLRDLKASQNLALEHSVPLYMYIPPRYTGDFKGFAFERDKLGSHKDIFPTLYALSLNDYDFLTLGGRNLFDSNADSRYNFAINGALWIDEFGIYPNGAKMGYTYTLQNGEFVMSGESVALSQEKADFMERYNALNRAQINYRVGDK